MSRIVTDKEERAATSRIVVQNDGIRRLRGNPIVFNSLSVVMHDPRIGQFREVIHPEAVDRTLREATSVKALWNHNSDLVLGNTRAGTLILRKTASALSMELTPPSWAEPQMETVERGDVDGMSFAFRVPDGGDEWTFKTEDGVPLREVYDMNFKEVSIVAFPAYPATDVSVSQRSYESFIEARGMSIDFALKLHRTNLAR